MFPKILPCLGFVYFWKGHVGVPNVMAGNRKRKTSHLRIASSFVPSLTSWLFVWFAVLSLGFCMTRNFLSSVENQYASLSTFEIFFFAMINAFSPGEVVDSFRPILHHTSLLFFFFKSTVLSKTRKLHFKTYSFVFNSFLLSFMV